MIYKFQIKKSGFTLVEMLIAVGLFATVTSMSIGAILSIFDANRRAVSMQSVMDNLNFSIAEMARTVRFGSNYHCDNGTGTVTNTADCPGGNARLAVNYNGNTIIYRLNGTVLETSTNGGTSYVPITSPDMVVQYLRFYVSGSTVGDTTQAYVVVVIKGYVGNKLTAQSQFSIQTTMSRRAIDLE